MSRTIGLSRAQRWGKVIVPSLIPGAMLGARGRGVAGGDHHPARSTSSARAQVSGACWWRASSASTHRRRGGCSLIVGLFGYADEPGPFVAGAPDRPWRTASRPRASACVVDQRRSPPRQHLCQLLAVTRTCFHHRSIDMALDGANGKRQPLGDCSGRLPATNQHYDLALAGRSTAIDSTLSGSAGVTHRQLLAVPARGHGQNWLVMLLEVLATVGQRGMGRCASRGDQIAHLLESL